MLSKIDVDHVSYKYFSVLKGTAAVIARSVHAFVEIRVVSTYSDSGEEAWSSIICRSI